MSNMANQIHMAGMICTRVRRQLVTRSLSPCSSMMNAPTTRPRGASQRRERLSASTARSTSASSLLRTMAAKRRTVIRVRHVEGGLRPRRVGGLERPQGGVVGRPRRWRPRRRCPPVPSAPRGPPSPSSLAVARPSCPALCGTAIVAPAAARKKARETGGGGACVASRRGRLRHGAPGEEPSMVVDEVRQRPEAASQGPVDAPRRGREQGQGKDGPVKGAPGQPGRLRAGPRPTRPGQPAREPGQDAGARARAHPLRAHARLALHLLPRGGADHGVGPVDHAPVGADGPGVRRRAPLQLRHLRLARAQPGVRLQRLRRDVARPVGMGREAAGGQLRRSRRASGVSPRPCAPRRY